MGTHLNSFEAKLTTQQLVAVLLLAEPEDDFTVASVV